MAKWLPILSVVVVTLLPVGLMISQARTLCYWEQFCSLHPDGTIALGIGGNNARESIAKKVTEAGYSLATLIHPSAIISDSAVIKEGSVIMPLAVVNADALIGEGCIVNSGAIVEHDCILENYVHISPNATLAGRGTY